MSSFRIRPRFKHLVSDEINEVEARINQALEKKGKDVFQKTSLSGHITIRTPLARRHFWSPQLHLTFEQTDEGTVVRGLYGPNPTVWAVFFFGYVTIGILSLFLGMWGLSRWSLDLSYDILWSIPALGACAVLLYVVAQAGQKVGSQEMFDLHHFYEEVVHDKVVVS
ncbi:MAG: hypothetical protein JXQ90_10655 [Cyclobacteriaceae bacterium]